MARETVGTCSVQMQYLIIVSTKGWLGNSQAQVITRTQLPGGLQHSHGHFLSSVNYKVPCPLSLL